MISAVGKRRRLKSKGAFTLIELILVSIIILTLIGLSTPLFRKTISGLTVKETTFSISKLISYAQERAIVERKNFKINFNFKDGNYQIWEYVAAMENPGYRKLRSPRIGRLYKLPQGITFTGSKAEVVLYPDGHCDEINIKIISKVGGYSITTKGFGSAPDIQEIKGQ